MAAAEVDHAESLEQRYGALKSSLASMRAHVENTYYNNTSQNSEGQGRRRAAIIGKKRKMCSPFPVDDMCAGNQSVTPTQDLLPTLDGELRHHQLAAVRWLASLVQQGAGGILGDEQQEDRVAAILGLLSYLQGHATCNQVLLVAPLSAIYSWQEAIQRACPTVRITMLGGTQEAPISLSHSHSNVTRESASRAGSGGGSRDGLPPRPRTDSSSTLAFTCAIAPWEALSELAPSLGSNSIVVADLDEPEAPNLQEASSAAQHQQRLLQLGGLRASTKILLTPGPPDLEAQDVWPLLQVVLPEVQGALWDTLHELRQAMLALAHTQDSHRTRVDGLQSLNNELAALLAPLLMARRADEVALASVRRGTTCSLFDTFAALSSEGDNGPASMMV